MPRGTVLAPLLFLLCTNKLCNASNVLKIHLFADVRNFFYSNTSSDQLEKFAISQLLNISNWLIANKLTLTINNDILHESECVKYLGILIDKNSLGRSIYNLSITS